MQNVEFTSEINLSYRHNINTSKVILCKEEQRKPMCYSLHENIKVCQTVYETMKVRNPVHDSNYFGVGRWKLQIKWVDG